MDEACGDHAVEMLRRASRLSVALVFDAYQRAGSPDLEDPASKTPEETVSPHTDAVATSAQPKATPTPDSQAAPSVKTRVASKRSKVFHLPSCTHVKRISKKNLVEYADEKAAKDSGKRGCRACNADTSDG